MRAPFLLCDYVNELYGLIIVNVMQGLLRSGSVPVTFGGLPSYAATFKSLLLEELRAHIQQV